MSKKSQENLQRNSTADNDLAMSNEIITDMTEITYPISAVGREIKAALMQSGIDEDLLAEIEIKPSPTAVEGDYGIHCAPFARKQRRNPVQIARELAEGLTVNPDGIIKDYVAVGPYLNIKVDYAKFGNLVRDSVFEMGDEYGKEKIGTGQRVVIDMSSPNIAKRMSVGHLRSTIIGDSLARIFKHLDFEVIKDNHLGDWGTQFGHLLRAIELWGDEKAIAENPLEELQKLYVRISDAGEPDSDLYKALDIEEAERKAEQVKNEGREWFKRLEQGDPEARSQWQQIVDWSLQEFQRMYDVLGVDFDWTRGESYYENHLPQTIQKVQESGITTESKGALVVNMEDKGLGVAIIQKSDKATLYLTREIATGIHRSEVENADGMIYVVGEDQKFYFQQFFEILRRMGNPIVDKSKHVYFGMIRLPEGKMSTRKGKVILLEDVVNEAILRTNQLVEKRTHVSSSEERTKLVLQIAIGALKWNDLMADPRRSIIFDWDSMLTMEGNSSPYVQYAFARTASLLEGIDANSLASVQITPEHETEKAIVKLIADFPEVVKVAGETYNPSKIATFVYDLAKAFNAFYHELSVLKAETHEKKMSRLTITASVSQTIQVGLGLLGIETPVKM